MGAVKALIELITSLNDEQGQDLSGAIDQTVADGVHLLFFLCFENQRNLTTLLANKGIQTLQACEYQRSSAESSRHVLLCTANTFAFSFEQLLFTEHSRSEEI